MTLFLTTPIERVIGNVIDFASYASNITLKFFGNAGPIPVAICVTALVVVGVMLMRGSPVKGV